MLSWDGHEQNNIGACVVTYLKINALVTDGNLKTEDQHNETRHSKTNKNAGALESKN